MSDKKVKVLLSVAVTYGGVDYPAGEQLLPEDVAKAAKKKKLGTIAGEESEESKDFTPLSIEETMERFGKGDSSDEVFQSLKFHQKTIVEGGIKGGKSRAELDAENSNQSSGSQTNSEESGTKFGEYPDDFPMAQVLHGLGVKFADVQKMSREELINLKGIGEKSADAILVYGK